MKEILDLLIDSQNILNGMKQNEDDAVVKLFNNENQLKQILKKIKDERVQKKYEEIHHVIVESAKDFLNSGKEVYKLQPLFHYYSHGNYVIDHNGIRVFIGENQIIFNQEHGMMEVHDELYIKNDLLFEKANIPLMIKSMISQKDILALNQLEDYIKDLISCAKKEIEGED